MFAGMVESNVFSPPVAWGGAVSLAPFALRAPHSRECRTRAAWALRASTPASQRKAEATET